MAITEQGRHTLYTEAIKSLGQEAATVLMETLPPVGWGDVATKQYVDHKFELVKARFNYEHEWTIQFVRAEMRKQTQTIVFAFATINCSFIAAAVAVTKLFS